MNFYTIVMAAWIASAGVHTAAQAQSPVLRCEDASGNVTYTNAGCAFSQEVTEVLPALNAQEQQRQDAQYQQALERKRAEQRMHAEQALVQQQADAARAAAQAAQRPPPAPVVVQMPASEPSTRYVPLPPPRPPHMRPPPPPGAPTHGQAVNCNVFRCYDGKGNTWSQP